MVTKGELEKSSEEINLLKELDEEKRKTSLRKFIEKIEKTEE
jgi:hypothetical protein